MFSHPENINFI